MNNLNKRILIAMYLSLFSSESIAKVNPCDSLSHGMLR
jgi:hypothetical protein